MHIAMIDKEGNLGIMFVHGTTYKRPMTANTAAPATGNAEQMYNSATGCKKVEIRPQSAVPAGEVVALCWSYTADDDAFVQAQLTAYIADVDSATGSRSGDGYSNIIELLAGDEFAEQLWNEESDERIKTFGLMTTNASALKVSVLTVE